MALSAPLNCPGSSAEDGYRLLNLPPSFCSALLSVSHTLNIQSAKGHLKKQTSQFTSTNFKVNMAVMTLPPSLQKGLDATKVEYVKLGSSGLSVSLPILGGMSLGSKEWAPMVLDEEESLELLKAAYDRGINTWDTANAYSNGLSEEIFGNAIRKFNIPREKVVIMTKCFLHVGEEPSINAAMFGLQLSQSKDYVNQGGECNPSFVFCW